MKERPILFNAPMVRAILDGRKTVTRRVVKPQPAGEIRRGEPDFNHWIDTKYWERQNQKENRGIGTRGFACPYGQPGGDRLYVRETFGHFERNENFAPGCEVFYRADGESLAVEPWRPSIHMPRWASRITLEITGVRVERLSEISEADALAEGIVSREVIVDTVYEAGQHREIVAERFLHGQWPRCDVFESAEAAYADLWKQINGPASWDANPWVWVVEFKPVATTR